MSLPKKRKKLEPSAGKVKQETRKPEKPSPQKNPATSKRAATAVELKRGFDLVENLDETLPVSETAAEEPVFSKTAHPPSQRAPIIIQKYVMLAIGAGVVPVPVLDIMLASGIQLKLVEQLAQLYEKEFSPTRAKHLIAALAGNYAVGVSSLWAVFSLAKAFPLLGSALGTVTMPVTLGTFTYAIGKVFSHYFALGGDLSNFDVRQNQAYFERQLKAGQHGVTSE